MKTTARGFPYIEFLDSNDIECTIQISSAYREEDVLIWFGANDIGLKEFVAYRKPSAWQDVELKQSQGHHFVANNRMHLTQSKVRELLPILTHFAETGELPSEDKP